MKYRRSTASGLLGAAASLLLHTLFMAAVVLGGSGDRQRFPDRPDVIGAGANSGSLGGESVERRIIVRFLTPVEAEPSTSTLDAQLSELLKTTVKLQITGPDTLPLPPLLTRRVTTGQLCDNGTCPRNQTAEEPAPMFALSCVDRC